MICWPSRRASSGDELIEIERTPELWVKKRAGHALARLLPNFVVALGKSLLRRPHAMVTVWGRPFSGEIK
jgi:hypothetical protein